MIMSKTIVLFQTLVGVCSLESTSMLSTTPQQVGTLMDFTFLKQVNSFCFCRGRYPKTFVGVATKTKRFKKY